MKRIRASLALSILLVFFALPAHAYESLPPRTFSDLVDKRAPSVVNIQVVQKSEPGGQMFFHGQPVDPNDPNVPDLFRRFFEQFGAPQQPPERRGQGSGVIISEDGYIATNHHVVDGATTITVILHDETELEGTVVGSDPKTDLALVKIDAGHNLAAASWGDSEHLRVGDWVVAIGNPFGLSETVTAGIVSAKGRVIGAGPYDDFIQTDASINPGNSGGPLFDLDGQIVGINTAIVAQSQGIGFAIPSQMARQVLDQLRENGQVVRGWLGVGIQEVTKELAEGLGLPSNDGVLISQIFEDSPASEADFEPEDVIVEYEGKPVRELSDLPRLVATSEVGKRVNVVVLRKGKRKELRPRIARLEEKDAVTAGAQPSEPAPAHQDAARKYGMELRTLSPELARREGLTRSEGVLIARVLPQSPAAKAALAPGDIIIEVEHERVRSVEDFARQARNAKEERLLLRVVRGDRYLFAVLRP